MLPEELETNETGVREEFSKTVLAGKHPPEKKSRCYTFEVYYETPILIPVGITEYLIGPVAPKLLGGSVPVLGNKG